MKNYQTIVVDVEERVAEIALNRPDLLNPLDEQAADELCDALERIQQTTDARTAPFAPAATSSR